MEPASPSPSQPAAVPPPADDPKAVPAAEETHAPAEEIAVPRLPEREARRPRDMIISLLVLLVPIALFMAFYQIVLDGNKPATKDPSAAVQQASQKFPVTQPAGLGDDWYVVSAVFRGGDGGDTLRLGYVDPDDDPIQLIQSTVPADVLVPAEVGKEGSRTGTFRDDSRTWQIYAGRPGETALIATEQNRTIIVLGATDQKNLETLAASLD